MNNFHKSQEQIKIELEQVEAAKADSESFAVLYDKYYKPVFIFVYRRTGREELTADLTSLVFLKALINIKKFKSKGLPFSAWLFRIALNEICMYFRKNNRERIVSLEHADIGKIGNDIENENQEEKDKLVMDALGQLPEASVQLIELRFFEKRSFLEVGNILGISENNAKVKVYRVLSKLKNIILNKGKGNDKV